MMLLPRKNNFSMDLWDSMFSDPFFRSEQSRVMKTDIKEKEKEYQIDIDMPGFDKEDIKIEIKSGYLTVSAEHNDEKDEKNEEGKYVYRERRFGTCQRSYFVGDNINEDDIKASYKHGILKLTVPKKTPQLPEKKFIAIE